MFQKATTKKSGATVQQDEKENNKRAPKAIGNADDFVGDEEESDEEVEATTKPAVVRGRARPVVQDEPVEMEEDEEEEKSKAKPTIYGAMDDFAKPTYLQKADIVLQEWDKTKEAYPEDTPKYHGCSFQQLILYRRELALGDARDL